MSDVNWPDKVRFDYILKNIPSKKNINILNLGCREGKLHTFLKRKYHQIIGLDFESTYEYNNLDYNKPDVYHDLNSHPYPFKNNTFDCIISGEVIEHLHNPTKHLEELNRILKKDGVLILTTPNASGIHILFEKNTDITSKFGHIQLFNESILKRLCNYVGFKVIDVNYNIYRKFFLFFFINKKFGANIFIKAIKK